MTKPIRKKKEINRTKLIMCEGVSDRAFIERLKILYHVRNCGFSVRLDDAGGGGPKSAILAAINSYGSFDKKYVFIDSDIPIPVDAKSAARNHGIIILQSTPWCLEGMLLKIMGHAGEIRDPQHAKDIMFKKYKLVNVVHQAWYDENISEKIVNEVISSKKHCCCDIISNVVNSLSRF
ncbi:Uncharacterised protein [Klebsiella quasipneumoniae]|uniref:hypothetical protein n=1 Tax=Klebsiella quasipneumoniae TaxID=1463165 RepID=UPI00108353F6|nr:hypothetical protein [Klebsiella quasipneumoniae]VGE60534.1 Uncharacterised protein [Klebsiella quasipneumoniae]